MDIPPHIAEDIKKASAVIIVLEMPGAPENKQMNFAFLGCDLPRAVGLMEQAKAGALIQSMRGNVLDVRGEPPHKKGMFEVKR